MSTEIKVIFQPSGRSVHVLPGTILLEAAARAGYVIETPCGAVGKCGKCLVKVMDGQCGACANGDHGLSAAEVQQGFRLACQCRVMSPLTVEVPETSLFQSGHKILESHAGEQVEVSPSVCKRCVQVPPPDRDDERSDGERLRDTLDCDALPLSQLRAAPALLRSSGFTVTATLAGRRVLRLEGGDTRARLFGLAYDIGTTTLVATLVDLHTGRDLAVSSRVNPQTSFGDDVVTRIKRCRDERDGLARLNAAILDAVNELARDAASRAGVGAEEVAMAVFAGNTTMQQILCGIDPRALGELPFVPAFRDAVRADAREFGLSACPHAEILVFPQIGGFVGGDTVAGIIATQLDRKERPALLVDVGTNGEIVLANQGRLIATSVAAGPAFEGARIANGMRATRGAIEKVVIDGDVQINVIGDAPAAGLCGTGLVDAAAYLLRCGVLDETGRILDPDELPAGLPDAVRRRVIAVDGDNAFVLADGESSASGRPLCLYQRDIRELQLANGAIRAGIQILLQVEGLSADDLGEVLLAGAFGNFIRRRNARRIGMLPQIPHERIRFVGNTASFGAKRALLSAEQAVYAERVVRETRHVDLSLRPDFQMEFSAAMIFPDGDLD
jgi:uncharacterized 2Fe-2S/4Fe-4S cluster protein (DUF4445 family)